MNHSLNIHDYTFEELLGLFKLHSGNISTESLKKAKKMVLFMHPDKSGLKSEYFLFYKKAFSLIVTIYEQAIKTNQTVPTNHEIDYDPTSSDQTISAKQIKKTLEKISSSSFQQHFNQMFEEQMTRKINTEKNKWFQDEAPLYETESHVNSVGQIGQAIESIKQRNNSMIVYKDVAPVMTSNGCDLYEIDDDDHYISSDPFSKLKFDDLRKVHKDQTVMAVSERDIDKVRLYKSVEQYQRARGNDYIPLDRNDANNMIEQREREYQQKIREKQYISQLRTMESEEKNKTILSSFLRLV
jgi:hypothetical protein